MTTRRWAQVQVRIDGSLPPTMADAGLLKIVVTNLLVNGAQAMQGRGIIRVSLASSRDTCQIAFADQGPGIPAGVAEKVFMPFFTTKARGSGLGLVTHLLRRPMLRRDPLAYRRSTHEP